MYPSRQRPVWQADLGTFSRCGLDIPSNNIKPSERWLRQGLLCVQGWGSGSRMPSETQSLSLLQRPDHVHFSLVVTGWLPYFQKLHPLSRQKEDERAKSFLSRDLGFLSGKGAGTKERASSLERTSHWLRLTGVPWLEGETSSRLDSE